MERWSDKSAFTNGFSKLIEDLALDIPALLCCLQVLDIKLSRLKLLFWTILLTEMKDLIY
ncbi:hypothetical protein HanRHA438_Chr01g0010241 [Helianthus annuus]|uniref:Uncharacterized protein n=1 Tax=Helianthus annuus TaxID=4232 RepID=A0A9K3JSU5_HELAN|nr:hypothetical protein HanXRQr2_Chr01g0009841 [Helianthus annuus]KAJ0610816.1 hypothetical protein HanHA300_Chr01g0008111 [Helianthus annuus]KAJ0621640.1 hypothetical protein HanIR_Chr01g0011011 [Helianthus annuus]KAJ0803936.1 hypothetical protein HanLR1_Chr00c1576g0810041 [Helianthus annuus]KAJ0946996.1 hypothetical protein HanRHA438_Chr01g0010241 [Helianthus annuus]